LNYLDTSALVKRFVTEKGSDLVSSMIGSGEPIGTAKIAYAEIFWGLARRRRASELSESDYSLACQRFETDWSFYLRVDLLDEILSLARKLIERYPLRAFDAIHLASAMTLGRAVEETVTFVAADTRLLHAAEGEGLPTLNPED
jgi:predicted nucleic acid-binding protein